MQRGEVWIAQVGRKRRPVLVLTRSEVLDVRSLVTVAEITTVERGLSTEVPLDPQTVGIEQPSVVNADGLHTVGQSLLSHRVGFVDGVILDQVCAAIATALDCRG